MPWDGGGIPALSCFLNFLTHCIHDAESVSAFIARLLGDLGTARKSA
jgi:hypothetical protein